MGNHDEAHVSESDASDSLSARSSSSSDAAPAQTQWLATTRSKRSTAGNRIQALLASQDPDSDLELLFAEDDDDDGFSEASDGASDLHMDSSSDDDDPHDDAHADALDGERELHRQARAKRKAPQAALPARFRKRVRIRAAAADSPAAASSSALKNKKKKSDRASWLPSPADLPTRASARDTTRASKQLLHLQMAEREARRLRHLALQQKKAARLEAERKPPMTQAQRLAEAAVVEKRNAKSLNRWQEAEKQRDDDRRAKLAALNNRTLSGPVMTFWSGVRQWNDALGQHVTLVEPKPKKKREKTPKPKPTDSESKTAATPHSPPPELTTASAPQDAPHEPSSTAPTPRPSGFLAAPTLAPPPPPPPPLDAHSPQGPPTAAFKSNVLAPPATSPPPPAPADTFNQFRFQLIPLDPMPGKPHEPSNSPPPPAVDKTPRTTARNAIIFQNFDNHALRDKTIQTQILFGRKMARLPKPIASPACAITNLPARYRDPLTGLPYRDAAAYSHIQRLRRGEYCWSRLLGAWVGTGICAARGVPTRFLHPEPEEVRKRRSAEKLQAQKDKMQKAQDMGPDPNPPAKEHPHPPVDKPGVASAETAQSPHEQPQSQQEAAPDAQPPAAMPQDAATHHHDSPVQDPQQPAAASQSR